MPAAASPAHRRAEHAPSTHGHHIRQAGQSDSSAENVLRLQRDAGNHATCQLVAACGDHRSVQRETGAVSLIGGLTMGLASSLLSYLQGVDLSRAAVQGLVAMGVRDEGDLTNLVFWARHPEATLRKVQPGETALAADWLRIRNSIVRPALRPEPATGGRTEPGAGPKTPTTTPTTGGSTGADRPSGGGIGADRLGEYRDAAATVFRREVYAAQLERNHRMKKEFFPGLPPAELDTVEGDHRLHIDAAGDARSLFAAARADLAAAKEAGDADAAKVSSIGIGSAYRDPEDDFRAWKKAFNTHYNSTASSRDALPDGPHGPAAVKLMVARMVVKKAVPGFSNHTRGLAIDFTTHQGEWSFGASSAQMKGWVTTWLYAWLTSHAPTYHFLPYEAEPWHWDHTG